MKASLIVIFVSFLGFANAQNKADSIIGSLINSKDYFGLNDKYLVLKENVSPMLQDLSESLTYSYFNKSDKACESIRRLISNHQQTLGLSNVSNMFYLWAQNLKSLGKYKEASALLKSFIAQVPTENQTNLKLYYTTIIRYCDALSNYDAGKIIRPDKDIIIPITIKPVGQRGDLIFLPVKIKNKETQFIFDSGAGDNYVSAKFAQKYGIKLVGDSLLMSGAGSMFGKIGFIDSLCIGNLLYKNVTCVIGPENPTDKYNIDAVLGAPFIKLVGEIQLFPKNSLICLPAKKTPLPSFGSNLMIQGDLFYLKAFNNENELLFHFDTGNVSSDLSNKYFKNNQQSIEKIAKLDTIYSGGFGAFDTIPVYKLPVFSLQIGDCKFEFNNVDVSIRDINKFQNNFEGTVGMSLIKRFDEIILNTDGMFLIVKNFSRDISNLNILPNYQHSFMSNYNLQQNGNERKFIPGNPFGLQEPSTYFQINNTTLLRKVDYCFNDQTNKWESRYDIIAVKGN